MVTLGGGAFLMSEVPLYATFNPDHLHARLRRHGPHREFFIDNLLFRIHLIIEMILVDRPCAMGV